MPSPMPLLRLRPAALAAALGVAATLLLGGCAGLPKEPAPTNAVRFLLVNDVYVTDTLADGTGGLARVATLRDRIAATGPTLFVLAGDVLSPSLLSKYYSGRQMVEAFNAAKLDYATLGNHEFELDRDTLVARIAASKFKWLSANCTEASGAAFPGVRAWDTVTVQTRKVGLFGLTLQGDYRRYVRCADPDSAARRAVDTLTALGVELVVGLTHQSVEADAALLQRDPRIHLILGGHEHDAHTVKADDRYLLKADANSRSAQFATLWAEKAPRDDKPTWRQAVTLVPIDDGLQPDTAVQRVVDRWRDSLRARLGAERVVGSTTIPIDARDALSRNGESLLGDLITDAMRTGTGTDVALINAGTLRLDDVIEPGPISNWDLESIFLFADEARVVTFALTGARLREVLEHGVAPGQLGKGGFLQVSGVRFTYDPAQPAGRRIVGDLRRAGGGAIRPTDTVRVAMPVYPACEGGDRYSIPEAAEPCRAAAQGPRSADLLIRHLEGPLEGTLRAAPEGERITRKG